MKIRFECSECGESIRVEYEENNKIVKVHPCKCEDPNVKLVDNTLIIGEGE